MGKADFRSEVVSALSGADLVNLTAKLSTEAMFHSSFREEESKRTHKDKTQAVYFKKLKAPKYL